MCFAQHDLAMLSLPSVTVSMDQEGSQWASVWYLMYKTDLLFEAVPDVHHRAYNDMKLSVHASGLWPVYLNSLICSNMAYGPWHTSEFFRQNVAFMDSYAEQLAPNNE